MRIAEKVAYIKGLMEGLDLDADRKETAVLKEIVEALGLISQAVSDLEDDIDALDADIDELSEDLESLEDSVFDDEDEDDDDEDADDEDEDDDDADDEDADDEDGEEDDDAVFELNCPNCDGKVYIDNEVLDRGHVTCPGCAEELVLSIEDDEDGCGHDCCCGHDHDHEDGDDE